MGQSPPWIKRHGRITVGVHTSVALETGHFNLFLLRLFSHFRTLPTTHGTMVLSKVLGMKMEGNNLKELWQHPTS